MAHLISRPGIPLYYIYHLPPELAGYVTLFQINNVVYQKKTTLPPFVQCLSLHLSISQSTPTSLFSAHLQKKLNIIMMNAIHSVTKYGWLTYVSIKDLIVSFSGPLHGTAQAAHSICDVSNSMYSNKFA